MNKTINLLDLQLKRYCCLMKTLFICLMLFSFSSRAELLQEVPDYYCSDEFYNCGNETKAIVSEYFAANQVISSSEESLYVGSCYMVSENYHNDKEHYGYLYFRPQNDGVGFFGSFAYFYESNPFSDLTVEKAGGLNPKNSDYLVQFKNSHAQIDTNIDPPWQYFIREMQGSIKVIGYWGLNDSIVCRMNRVN